MLIALPIKTVQVVNNAIAYRIDHLAGIGINAMEPLSLVLNYILILLPWFRARHISVPIATAFIFKRMGTFLPLIKFAHNLYKFSVRRPNTENRAFAIDDRAHPFVFDLIYIFIYHRSSIRVSPSVRIITQIQGCAATRLTTACSVTRN